MRGRAEIGGSGRPGAFTLVEVLVALAVLSLLVLLVGQLMVNANSTITASRKRIDALGQARAVFDRMTMDFAGRLRREDVDASFEKHPGDDSMAFYSATRGLYPSQSATADTRVLSVVGYRVSRDSKGRPRLERGARGLSWSDMVFTPVLSGVQKQRFTTPNSLPAIDVGSGPGNYQVLSDSVVRMEISYLLKADATHSSPRLAAGLPADVRDISAVVVTIAVLDEQSRKLVGDYDLLQGAFPDAEDGVDPLAVWSGLVNSIDFARKAGIPLPAAQSVRLYQRYFPLP